MAGWPHSGTSPAKAASSWSAVRWLSASISYRPISSLPGSIPSSREWVNPGGSAIIDPTGAIIAGPIEGREEILYAEIDLDAASGANWDLDTAGHYARPDIFALHIDRGERHLLDGD